MNWHFIFFLLDIVVWVAIAALLCNRALVIKSKVNLGLLERLGIISITLFVGFLSVLVNGVPSIGFSIDSFLYVFIASYIIVVFLRLKTKKEYLPKISKRNKNVAYI